MGHERSILCVLYWKAEEVSLHGTHTVTRARTSKGTPMHADVNAHVCPPMGQNICAHALEYTQTHLYAFSQIEISLTHLQTQRKHFLMNTGKEAMLSVARSCSCPYDFNSASLAGAHAPSTTLTTRHGTNTLSSSCTMKITTSSRWRCVAVFEGPANAADWQTCPSSEVGSTDIHGLQRFLS